MNKLSKLLLAASCALFLVAPASAQFEPNNVITVNLLSNITGSNWTGTNALWAKGRASVNDGLGGLYVRLSGTCVVNATTCVQDTSGAYWQFSGGFSSTTGFAAAGSNTNVQYNSGGALGANSSFTYDGTGNVFVGSYLNVGSGAAGCSIAPINVGGCATNSVNPIVNITGTYDCPVAQNCHVYTSSRDINIKAGMAANDYDSRGTVVGSVAIDHFADFQAAANYNGTGTVDWWYMFFGTGTNLTTGTVTNACGICISGFSPGFGTLINNYGIRVEDLAGTNQFGIYQVGTDDTNRLEGLTGMGVAPIAGQRLAIRETTSLGSWLAGFWVQAANFPTMRMWATTADKWSGLGTDAGDLEFLVNASGSSGSPTVAGTIATNGGLVWGAATGGSQGAGTINVDTNIYKDGVAYTNPDYVFEHRYNKGKIVRFAKNEGAKEYKGLQDLEKVELFVRSNYTLPRVAEARKRGNGQLGLFDGGEALQASLEEGYLYIFEHERKIKALISQNSLLKYKIGTLEARVARLEKLMGGGR